MWNFLDFLWHPPSNLTVSNCLPRDVMSAKYLKYMVFLKIGVDVAGHLWLAKKSDLILMQLISVSIFRGCDHLYVLVRAPYASCFGIG